MSYLLAFFAALVLDAAWAVYIKATADGAALLAAVMSVVTGGLGLYGVSQVVASGWLAVPWCAGLAVGTYLVVRSGRE